MLEGWSAWQILAAGVAVGALAVVPLVYKFRAQVKDAETERRRAENLGHRSRDILSATPDGIFLWDHTTGGISCSRRLADLLKLQAGTLARYDDIRACFDEDELQKLEQGVSLLRAKGTPFDIVLNQGDRTLQAVGSRAQDVGGMPVADIVWMRDVVGGGQAGADGGASARNRSGLGDKHLTALLDTLPIPLWLRDADLNLAFLNRAAERIRGLDAAVAERARTKGMPSRATLKVTENERALDVDVTETPLSPANAQAGGTIGFAVETTDKPADAPAKPGAVADLLKPLQAGVAVYNADTTLEAANRAFAEIWSLDPDWLDTKPPMADILIRLRELRRLPEVADFAVYRREEMSVFGNLKEMLEDDLHLPDGRTLRRRTGPTGDGGVVMVYEDVSGNLDLQRSLNALDKVQRTTLENLREGVAVFGLDGRLQLINQRMLDLWDLNTDELTPDLRLPDVIQTLGMRMAANDEAWADRKARISAEILDRKLSVGQVELTDSRMLAFANIPLPDGATLVSYADITDSFRVEEALRERARTLAEADRMKTEFIAKVANEVRTPLNTISGYADILSQQMFGELNDRQKEYADGILQTSATMHDVVADIFDLATIEAGRMKLEKDTIDPHAVLVGAFNRVKTRAASKNLQMDFDCPPDIGWITADPDRLTQIAVNLLNNAVQFTPKLGQVRLSAERDDEWLEIVVNDSGPGIPKAERARVFEPFQRLNIAGQSSEGSGLGLTIVGKFVALHGGTIEISSNRAKGTRITCRIPVDDVDAIGVAETQGGHAIVTDRAAE